ncbi:hypothetical protein [Ramlibacter tataouinensis]|uniref:HAMP domain-containing protein n=1 Tax=Ramlibacter tataouinensis (strain ATCC BAA-407 / DSM 14655 / LMG 21543 / TTB310) TaxID=365046 RepID=F5Y1G1_RAMTT|nr:hypothetical protein [Ramlibacter tataouinensis]AEG94745.1 Conserved hypothetical protein [Ramlibacter tataouinensis TTB310]
MSLKSRWYDSVAVKSFVMAFLSTHIPLLGLIALIVLFPDALTPWGVFTAALALTLVATVLVLASLWRLFEPLRRAADGLQRFMTEGRLFEASGAGQDEVGRLLRVLVRALAHLDRSRAPLLDAGAFALSRQQGVEGAMGPGGWMALLEIDQWQELDRHAHVDELVAVQRGLTQALEAAVGPGESLMSWGRGRALLMLAGSGAEVKARLERLCSQLRLPVADRVYTASAVIEQRAGTPRSWPAGLQRLEYKLFSLRMANARSHVA